MSCPDCFTGSVHDGTPRGQESKIQFLDAYVVEPADGRPVRALIVVITDAFGWKFVNNRLLADNLADKGDYRVIMPDFMEGGAAPEFLLDSMKTLMGSANVFSKANAAFWTAVAFIPWAIRQRPSRSYPLVRGWFEEMQISGEVLNGKPLFAAGYCWGGKHVCLLAGSTGREGGKPLIDAGFTAHPSMLTVPEDIQKMTAPVSFALAEKDHRVTRAVADQIEAVVVAKTPEESKGEVRIYEGVGHGFAIRADFTVSDVAKQAGEAEDQAIAWFNARVR